MKDKIKRCLSCNEQISESDNIYSTDKGYYHDVCVDVVATSWLIFDKFDTAIFEEVENCDAEIAFLALEEDEYLKEED